MYCHVKNPEALSYRRTDRQTDRQNYDPRTR